MTRQMIRRMWLPIIMVLFVGCGQKGPKTDWEKLKLDYLEGLFLAKPHLATFMGDHRFEDRLVDVSPEGIQKRKAALEEQKQRLRQIDFSRFPLDEQIDMEIVASGIDLELLYLQEIKEWEWDPRLHDSFPYYDPREVIASRISDIIHGDYAPAEQRTRHLTAQMTELPGLLRQMKSQLKNPARVYTQQAIEDNKGRIEMFRGELRAFLKQESLSGSIRETAQKAYQPALSALEDYQAFLEKELLPRSRGDWQLGTERYHKKFPLALQTSLKPEAVIPRAELAFKVAKDELYQASLLLHKELFPRKPAPEYSKDPASQAKLIRLIKEELSKDHPAAADLVEAHRRNLEDFRKFIEEHHLLRLPSSDTLVVKEMPPFKRGVSAAEYLAPGVLEKKDKWQATYYVDPIDPTWKPQQVESYLQANNTYEVQLTAIHEAYPGHHVQFSYSRQNLDPLRAVLWNAPMVEGWAVYCENLMTRLGFGGEKNIRYHFFARRGDMIVATNIMLDIKLHTGQMSEKEAVRFMVEEGFQEQAQAEKKLQRAKLDSTQLAQYFLGYDEILQLERDYRQLKKEKFSQQEFDEALINHGSLAVRYLRKLLLPPPAKKAMN